MPKVRILITIFFLVLIALSTSASTHTANYPNGVSNVTVSSDGSERGIWLEFDSAALGVRAISHVTLPINYSTQGKGWGTLYRLNGTRDIAPADVANRALEDPSNLPGLGFGLADKTDAAEQENFLVVWLNAGGKSWCNSCWWVDGRNGQGVLAETHLLKEVIPTVEAVFNVRTDRGGRAVYGHSMGGIGALIQAFRHPDIFGYVASQSGPESAHEHNEVLQNHQDGLYYGTYMIGQGYPNPVTHPIAYRNIDVVTLAPQMAGSDVEILLWAGDGCLPPYTYEVTPGDPDCYRGLYASEPPDAAFHMINEWGIRTDNEVMANRLVELGIPFRLETGHGRHGKGTAYEDHVIADFNRSLKRHRDAPKFFGYKTTDLEFSIWNYDLEIVERRNEEFLHLLGARTDGSSFTLAGSGKIRITTPAIAREGKSVDVKIVRENAEPELFTVTSDANCRVTLELDLGEQHLVDQRQSLSEQGLYYRFPRTQVQLIHSSRKPNRHCR